MHLPHHRPVLGSFSMTEGPVELSPIRQGSIAPSVHRLPAFERRHNFPEFMQISRDALRQFILAGAERNQRRPIALSL
jgi:hypothetical protein